MKKKVIFLCHFLLLFVRVIKRLTSFSFKFDLLTGLVLRNKDDILGYQREQGDKGRSTTGAQHKGT